jgi:hypothetical protein
MVRKVCIGISRGLDIAYVRVVSHFVFGVVVCCTAQTSSSIAYTPRMNILHIKRNIITQTTCVFHGA